MFTQELINNMSQDELIQYSDTDPRCATALARAFDGGELDDLQSGLHSCQENLDESERELEEAKSNLETKDNLLEDIGRRRDEIMEEFAAGKLDESELGALFDSILEVRQV